MYTVVYTEHPTYYVMLGIAFITFIASAVLRNRIDILFFLSLRRLWFLSSAAHSRQAIETNDSMFSIEWKKLIHRPALNVYNFKSLCETLMRPYAYAFNLQHTRPADRCSTEPENGDDDC